MPALLPLAAVSRDLFEGTSERRRSSGLDSQAGGREERRRSSGLEAGAGGQGGQRLSDTRLSDTSAGGSGGAFLDQYTLGQMLGQGAFGIVYVCTAVSSREEFAVKMVDRVETPAENIQREVDLQRKMDHPNIAKVLDVFFEKCFVCMVMEMFRGGDLIEGIEHLLDQTGHLDCTQVVHVSRQMVAAVHYMHGKLTMHRDVKADNYLLDRANLADRDCRAVLCDFGTATCLSHAGERLTAPIGTKTHWAPEVFGGDYSQKADVWSLGVVMYGLYEGMLPFNASGNCRTTEVRTSPNAPQPCADFVAALLRREETERPSAELALAHPWLERQADAPEMRLSRASTSDLSADAMSVDVMSADDQTLSPGLRAGRRLRATRVNVMVKERRRQLVQRMEQAQQQQVGRSEQGDCKGVPVFLEQSFCVTDDVTGVRRSYKWSLMSQTQDEDEETMAMVRDLDDSGVGARRSSRRTLSADQGSEDATFHVVCKMLSDYGVDTSGFGRGTARTLREFAAEVHSGQSRLMLDAASHKKLVRVVDVVLLRIWCPQQDKEEPLLLIESSQTYSDGRRRDGLTRLPGGKKRPHQNTRKSSQHLVKTLDMEDCKIRFNFENIEVREVEEDSPTYPGVRTVYRKEIIDGLVNTTNKAVLERIGALELAGERAVTDARGQTRGLMWLTEAECESRSVDTAGVFYPSSNGFSANGFSPRYSPSRGGFSALVQAPLGPDNAALETYLQMGSELSELSSVPWQRGVSKSFNHRWSEPDVCAQIAEGGGESILNEHLLSMSVDVSKFGANKAKTVKQLAQELYKGESALVHQEDGNLLRIVDMVILKLEMSGTGEVLFEVSQASPDGTMEVSHSRFPGDKCRPDENQFIAARRILKRRLDMDENWVSLSADVRVVEMQADSPSYPGLQTLYRKRLICGEVYSPAKAQSPRPSISAVTMASDAEPRVAARWSKEALSSPRPAAHSEEEGGTSPPMSPPTTRIGNRTPTTPATRLNRLGSSPSTARVGATTPATPVTPAVTPATGLASSRRVLLLGQPSSASSQRPGWRSHPELRWRPARDGRRRARGRARGGPGGRSLAAEPGRRPAGGCRRRALRGRGRELRGGQSPRAGGRRAPARDEEPRGRSPAVRPSWRPARDCRRRIPGWVACECCEGGPHRPAVRAVLRRRRHRPRPGLRTGAGEAARIVGLGWRVPRVPRG
ncbi:unnamed protein product [Prorocentrum cordatum]|uniref:Protein kinase domain-containing protein n=1 Tax=Prorocentrum cordatum TaxID=2364126 RepID=A0ABN9RXB8_9DINO|nr:unnamed protein product [Polarella glacialis]